MSRFQPLHFFLPPFSFHLALPPLLSCDFDGSSPLFPGFANHTILLVASIFNPLIDMSFWKCRRHFAFPSQSLSSIRGFVMQGVLFGSCWGNRFAARSTTIRGKSSDKRCPCQHKWLSQIAVMAESGVKFRAIFCLLVHSHYHLTHPFYKHFLTRLVTPVWLGCCARLTQPTWLTRHPRTILYHIVSSLITHKLRSASVTSRLCEVLGLGALWEVVAKMTRWVSEQLSTLVWTTWWMGHDGSEKEFSPWVGSIREIRGLKACCALQSVSLYKWAQSLEHFLSKISPYWVMLPWGSLSTFHEGRSIQAVDRTKDDSIVHSHVFVYTYMAFHHICMGGRPCKVCFLGKERYSTFFIRAKVPFAAPLWFLSWRRVGFWVEFMALVPGQKVSFYMFLSVFQCSSTTLAPVRTHITHRKVDHFQRGTVLHTTSRTWIDNAWRVGGQGRRAGGEVPGNSH